MTLAGGGLSAAAAIAIDGVACAVNAGVSTAAAVVCVTGQRTAHVSPSTVKVTVPGVGLYKLSEFSVPTALKAPGLYNPGNLLSEKLF